MGPVTTQPTPVGTPGYIKSQDPVFTQDVAKAKSLVQQAGGPVSMTCYEYPGLGFETAAPIIIAEEKAVGINLKIIPGTPAQVGGFFTDKADPACFLANYGGSDAADPYIFRTTKPRVAILNNGARKGGAAETLRTLHALPGTDTWQLHRSTLPNAENFAETRIANLSEATANWILIRASEDGSFVVTNNRNYATIPYPARLSP